MKVHVIGLAGSGKTTLARWIGEYLRVPRHDLDWVVYDQGGERPPDARDAGIAAIRSEGGWVTEGAYHEPWLTPLLDDADRIVWLDIGAWRCIARIVRRHVLAEIRRDNPHPGWRKLWRFMRYARRTWSAQRADAVAVLAGYRGKVSRCRTSGDLERVKRELSRAAGSKH